jgi:flavorubredoxin
MKTGEIRPGIIQVGVNDWDRRLFDSLIPLPDGTSYNSYLVRGNQKTALVDTADPTMASVLFEHLARHKADKIDYIIANHAEQDHAGSLPDVLARFPNAKIVVTPKCKGILVDLLHLPETAFLTVADGELLSLGDKTLEFIHFPWVHWPETMLTFVQEDKILLSGDLFGSHLATNELFVTDEGHVQESAKRYFAEIMMPFRTNIEKNLDRVTRLSPAIIAPSHGPAYAAPALILDAYKDWVYSPPKNIVVIAYVSMHGSTRLMVQRLGDALSQQGVGVRQFDLTVTDSGKLALSLVDAATVVLGTPTVLGGAHPKVAYAAILANALRPRTAFLSIIGSYGWGGKTLEQLSALIPSLKVEVLPPVLVKGLPQAKDYEALDNLATVIANKHRERHFAAPGK